MKNITGWAAASTVIAILGACTVEVTEGSPDGGTSSSTTSSSSTTGSAGSASSTTSSSSTTTTGTGGSGGASGDAGGGVCTAKSGDTACRTCALDLCHDETCACEENTACGANVGDFYTCLSSASGTLAGCLTSFSVNANTADGGASRANDLASCMADCEDRCKGRDAGAHRPRR